MFFFRFQWMSFTTELERFLCAVKDELDSEVQSMLLFPFDEANMTDATLGYAILQTGGCCKALFRLFLILLQF